MDHPSNEIIIFQTAELAYRRVDARLPLVGMQSFDKGAADAVKICG
jgi:hypothetical protein